MKQINLEDLEQTADVKIEKLSKNEDFFITVKAIAPTTIAKIKSKTIMGVKTSKAQDPVFDLGDLTGREVESNIAVIIAGWEESGNKEIHKIFNVTSAKDLINKMMFPADISKVAAKILEISDINEVEEEKKQ